MKKNEERNLTWKLGELPTAGELADLVDAEVITKEEAREIMFGSPESDKEVIKTLQEQITFLQDLVKELSKSRTTYIPTFTREVRVTPYFEKYWMNTNKVLGYAGYTLTTATGTGSKTFTAGSISGTSGTNVYHANSNSTPAVMSVSLSHNVGDSVGGSKLVS